ncbi:hypothetical protein VTH82DRAFT_1517 [Thermothelomyces myriococcoides]
MGQVLHWKDTPGSTSSSPEARLWELKTKLQVYRLARTVELKGLKEIAKNDIEQSGPSFDVFTVIDAVNEAYPTPPEEDMWFNQWIKTTIKRSFADPARPLSFYNGFGCKLGDNESVLKFLFQCMLETYADMLKLSLPATQHYGSERWRS